MSATSSETFSAMSTTGKIATGVIALALVASAWALWKVGGALLAPSLHSAISVEDSEADQKNMDYIARVEANSDFLTARSPFIPPAPPSPPEPEEDDQERDTPPPPTPRKYGGPKLVGVAGDMAYFASAVLNGEPKIKMGEKGGSVEFVRIVRPSTAILKWRGEEWPIDLLEGINIASASGPGATVFPPPNNASDPSRNIFIQQGSSPNDDIFQFEPDEESEESGLFESSTATGAGSPAGNN